MSEEQQYAAMIADAEAKEACAEGLAWARQFSTLEEALTDAEAAYWAYYYACDVLKAGETLKV